jgi:hypothetical protein
LDHENDIITMAGHLKSPLIYYVLKELKVFELAADDKEKGFSLISILHNKSDDHVNVNAMNPSATSSMHFKRKWIRIGEGSIIKALRLVDIDYIDRKKNEIKTNNTSASGHVANLFTCAFSLLKDTVCCDFSKKEKSEIAIELSLIESFDGLIKNSSGLAADAMQNVSYVQSTVKEKIYYLPVNEQGLNESIDLIPISSTNDKFEPNSLQTVKDLINFDQVKNNKHFDLKLFVESPFKKNYNLFECQLNKAKQNLVHDAVLVENNLNRVFEIYDIKQNFKILIAYSLKKECLCIIPLDKSLLSESIQILKSHESSHIIKNFKLNDEKFVVKSLNDLLDRYELTMLEKNLIKLETFNSSAAVDEGSEFLKPPNELYKAKVQSIAHFADLIDADQNAKSRSMSVSNTDFVIPEIVITKTVSDMTIDSEMVEPIDSKQSNSIIHENANQTPDKHNFQIKKALLDGIENLEHKLFHLKGSNASHESPKSQAHSAVIPSIVIDAAPNRENSSIQIEEEILDDQYSYVNNLNRSRSDSLPMSGRLSIY